ncbi:MAG: TetM/TetW/TetO/TetS family tetracycline resistance ribosomal protection protein [Firmicutes bacterium]|nr:TetM/TetW/TetO/TetS family tetracycline resistance ribosomal protection protein [Bacillota bacterium]
MANNLVLGILAHVDAGKTTLSEAMLYHTGTIRKLGRVDHKTAFLDHNAIEQNRGITVFSKEARFIVGEKNFTLLDTPGHSDFSTEMERTLQVLDYAILVISGADGVQSHTLTLWKLLDTYEIPTFIFVNKMDQPGADSTKVMEDLKKQFSGNFVHFESVAAVNVEELAECSEKMMEEYFDEGVIKKESISEAVMERKVFPVCFGSALKMEGVEDFIQTISIYAKAPGYGKEFGARVYKISRDKQGNRQAHLKVTGGTLKSKMIVTGDDWEEKIDQIRLGSGKGFDPIAEATGGMICQVTGLSKVKAGEGLGFERDSVPLAPILLPALTYRLILPEGQEAGLFIPKLRQIEEEEPSLHIIWKEKLQEIHVQVMGKLELEILQHTIKDRFDIDVTFGTGNIIYKETITKPVIGIGHFEPLKHYAEVHLLMEPLPRGSGIILDSLVSQDKLDHNWQRLIWTHLREREHPGVLTGSTITDMKISIIGGRGHLKHTEGGDFRQATYRAMRQGLRKAGSILLEPMYSFKAEIPNENVGRVLSDMQRFGANCDLPEILDEGMSLIKGRGPVAALADYPQEVTAFSKGRGRFTMVPDGFDRCHNEEEVIEVHGYLAEADLDNPTGSVFCDHGAAVYVPWDRVDEMAHVDTGYKLTDEGLVSVNRDYDNSRARSTYQNASAAELEEIFVRTYGHSKRDEALRRENASRKSRGGKPEETPLPKLIKDKKPKGQPYIIIDGYNVIFAWEQLKSLAEVNIDSAREALLELMENYRAYKKVNMEVVFDGYKLSGNPGSKLGYGELKVTYTKEAETADSYIEKAAFELGRKYDITVVTSDKSVQMAALGDGAVRMSSREFYGEVERTIGEIREKLRGQKKSKNQPFEGKL